MRVLREYPRMVLAKLAGAVCLVLAGIAIASALHGSNADRMHATELRLVSAQRSLTSGGIQLRSATSRAARADAQARRARAQVRTLVRSNRRLRNELAAAKRARQHTKSKSHK